MKSLAIAAIALTGFAQGFVVPAPAFGGVVRLAAAADEEVDFDAPAARATAVGNVVRSDSKFLFGMTMPSFLSNLFGGDSESDGSAPKRFDISDMNMDLDEECYLGKNGDLKDCADFDPIN